MRRCAALKYYARALCLSGNSDVGCSIVQIGAYMSAILSVMNQMSTAPVVAIVGAGLAGSEAALQLASYGVRVRLYEMRPRVGTPVHKTGDCAELVCSNSLKSAKPDSAAGMLKQELSQLHSYLYEIALRHSVAAGGALAVDRNTFSCEVTAQIEAHPLISLVHEEIPNLHEAASNADALILATGPLTSDSLATSLAEITGSEHLAFFDAAAPIVMADSLDMSVLFRQSRYEQAGGEVGDYLNAPLDRQQYEALVVALTNAERVVQRDFEKRDLFQACQPIEEIARKGFDAPKFGPLKPVGLIDPHTGDQPWAAVQLRAEDAHATCYNLVGFQTNLTFPEQRRVFAMIPGLEHAEFARYGVMHRNTFIDAPRLLDENLELYVSGKVGVPTFVAGQLAGTEGYCEAIRSGLHASIAVAGLLSGFTPPALPPETAFGALMAYACNAAKRNYQPMHVNFGIMPPLEPRIRNKRERYHAYAERGEEALKIYCENLRSAFRNVGAKVE